MADRAPAVCLIHGRGGLGKSELLRAVADRVSDRFPDGCLEIDLRGWTPGETPQNPDAVITEQLLHLGASSQRIPVDPGRRVTAWREHLKQRAVLLILDNAHDAAQLVPLLPWAGLQEPGPGLQSLGAAGSELGLEQGTGPADRGRVRRRLAPDGRPRIHRGPSRDRRTRPGQPARGPRPEQPAAPGRLARGRARLPRRPPPPTGPSPTSTPPSAPRSPVPTTPSTESCARWSGMRPRIPAPTSGRTRSRR